MKFLFPIILATVSATVAGAAEMRTFTSAEGSKTLQAKMLDYSAAKGTAKILRSDGKTMTGTSVHSDLPVPDYVLDGDGNKLPCGKDAIFIQN